MAGSSCLFDVDFGLMESIFFSVFVKLWYGKTKVIYVQHNDRVRAAVDVDRSVRVVYKNKTIEEGSTFADNNIFEGSTLHLELRLIGGSKKENFDFEESESNEYDLEPKAQSESGEDREDGSDSDDQEPIIDIDSSETGSHIKKSATTHKKSRARLKESELQAIDEALTNVNVIHEEIESKGGKKSLTSFLLIQNGRMLG